MDDTDSGAGDDTISIGPLECDLNPQCLADPADWIEKPLASRLFYLETMARYLHVPCQRDPEQISFPTIVVGQLLEWILLQRRKGRSLGEIADILGVNTKTIYSWRKKWDLPDSPDRNSNDK